MATEKAKAYDDEGEYLVKLREPVLYRNAPLLPRFEHEMTGRALNAIVEEYGPNAIDFANARK